MIALLLACGSPPTPPGSMPTGGEPIPTGAPGTPVPEQPLFSPAEAVDLDPDPDVLEVQLTAAPYTWAAGDGFAYNQQVPGPTLRAKVGDTLRVTLDNQLGMPTTIHWHGVDVPYAMDGAGWQIQPVQAGATFVYEFPLEQAGTFWYHPHFDTEHQVDLGLYGALIVEDPADPPVDDELVLVFDSVGEVAQGEQHPHVDPSPTRWWVNGAVLPTWEPTRGTTVRVRMVNASNAGYVALEGVEVIAHDRGLLAGPEDAVVLAPGDRAELAVRVDEAGLLESQPFSVAGPGVGPALPLFPIAPVGTDPAPEPLDWGFSGALPSVDPGTTDLRYTFTGSPQGGWEINGATFPDIAIDTFPLGSSPILEVRNPSPARHPYHLHGMPFEVLSIDGEPPALQRIEDTLDIGVQQTVRLRIDASNPGDWMSHCHILPHADAGMMTVLRVE